MYLDITRYKNISNALLLNFSIVIMTFNALVYIYFIYTCILLPITFIGKDTANRCGIEA